MADNSKGKILFITLLTLLSVSFAFPQIRETGTIQGNVTDSEGVALPGATVTIEGPNLIGGPRSLVTDRGGFYKFIALPPGEYKITAALSGFNKLIKSGIRLHANMTLTVDFKMTEAKIEEEVVVQAVRPTIDAKSPQTATVVFTTELIQTLPGKPSLSGLFNLAPGTDYYTAYGAGYSSPNVYQLDGVYISSPTWGGLNFAINTYIIEEANFQGLGMPAEFGESTGAVLTSVTKTGSNEFKGMIEGRYNGDGWNSQNKKSIPAEEFYNPATKDTKVKVGNYREVSGQIGGKIIHDKLWFLISGSYDYQTQHPIGTPNVRKYFTPTLFLKLTYQLNPANRFSSSFNYHNERGDYTLASATYPPDVDLNNYMAGYFWSASWTSIFSPTTYLDAKVGYNWKQMSQIPPKGKDVPGSYDRFLGRYSGNYPQWTGSYNTNWHISVHLSRYVSDFIKGSHDLKVGLEARRDKAVTKGGYCGGEYYEYYNGVPVYKYTQQDYVYDHYFGPIIAFIQDAWSVTKRLTLNIGLRYDHYWYHIPAKLAGTIYNKGFLSPRIGIAYDLLGDRKNILKFYYGILYEKIVRNTFFAAEPRSYGYAQYQWVDGTWVKILEYLAGEEYPTYKVDKNAKMPYIREFSGGFERELFKDVSLSINWYYKTAGAFIATVNMTAQWEKITIINPGYDGIEGTSDDLGPLDVYQRLTPRADDRYLITNPKKGMSPAVLETPWKKMRGFEIILNKRFSNRWEAIISYHYTKCTGIADNVIWSVSTPNVYVNNYGEMVYYYGQPHQFKIQGMVLLPFDINLGITGHYMSGYPIQAGFYRNIGGEYTFIRGFPWGPRWDSNKNASVKIEKKFKIKEFAISGYVDIYNVFNFHGTPSSGHRYTRFGPYYGKIVSVQTPRSYRIGARIYF